MYCAFIFTLYPSLTVFAITSNCASIYAKLNTQLQDFYATLTEQQKAAIKQATNVLEDESAYTPAQIANQEKILKKAKLDDKQIAYAKKAGLLNPSLKAEQIVTHPKHLKVITSKLTPLDKKIFKDAKNTQDFRYIVDNEDNVFLVDDSVPVAKDSLYIVKNGEQGAAHLIKEAGTLTVTPNMDLKFKPKYALSEGATEHVASLKDKNTIFSKLNREKIFSSQKETIISCSQILSKQGGFVKNLMDRFISDNLVVSSSFVASEMMGANRLGSKDGQQIIFADIINTNLGTAVGAAIARYTVQKPTSLPISLGMRAGTSLGMIELNTQIYGAVLENKAEERGSTIAGFNRMYLLFSMAESHFADQYILKKLPQTLYDSCRRGSKLNLVITPRTIRIAERYATTVLYFSVRSAAINE